MVHVPIRRIPVLSLVLINAWTSQPDTKAISTEAKGEGFQVSLRIHGKMLYTLPETNNKFAPENRPFAREGSGIIFQPSIFRCKLAVSFREGIYLDNESI